MKIQSEGVSRKSPCPVEKESLRLSALFAQLEDADLEQAARGSSCRVYRPFEEVGRPAEDEDAIFLVVQGLARVYAEAEMGGEQTLSLLWPGSLCGHVFIHPADEFETTLQAVTDRTTIYRILWQRVRELELKHPELIAKSRELAVERLHEVERWMLALRFESVPQRLERVLNRLADLYPDHRIPLTHQQLAVIVGASREAVTRALPELRERGLIATHQGRSGILVIDPGKLP